MSKFVMILVDRETSAQITASFNDINSIDQAAEGLARNLKKWNEEHSNKPVIDTSTVVEDAVKKYV